MVLPGAVPARCPSPAQSRLLSDLMSLQVKAGNVVTPLLPAPTSLEGLGFFNFIDLAPREYVMLRRPSRSMGPIVVMLVPQSSDSSSDDRNIGKHQEGKNGKEKQSGRVEMGDCVYYPTGKTRPY